MKTQPLFFVFTMMLLWGCSKETDESDNYPVAGVIMGTVQVSGTDITFDMALVKAGSFMMGCHEDAPYPYDDEVPLHKVTLTKDFYIGKTEVTQALYEAVMGTNPGGSAAGDNYPVAKVSYYEAIYFCERLSEMTGKRFNLPSEAQWEYAARGGHVAPDPQTTYAGSNNIDKVAWYKNNSGQKAHPVAQKAPNALGLYDMTGNVYEWCLDKYSMYSNEEQTDPVVYNSSYDYFITRGCCYSHSFGPRSCTVSSRKCYIPDAQLDIIGFRIIMEP